MFGYDRLTGSALQAVSGEKINPVLSRIIFVMFDLDSESNADGVDTFIKVRP